MATPKGKSKEQKPTRPAKAGGGKAPAARPRKPKTSPPLPDIDAGVKIG